MQNPTATVLPDEGDLLIDALIESERHSRIQTASRYPMPTTADNMAFAVSELGEVEDAILRSGTGSYLRNDPDRRPDPVGEMGQVLSQIASALLSLPGDPAFPRDNAATIERALAAAYLSAARISYDHGDSLATRDSLRKGLFAAARACLAMDVDPQTALAAAHAKRLARISK